MFRRKKVRDLKALQVEVTSRCTRKCELCPRSVFHDRWRDGDLGDALWQQIVPALTRAEHVHLQGWGEPLLHPRLSEMTAIAKETGATVGITTNGDLLESAIDWILKERVDLLTVSVAGNAQSHPSYRAGSRFEKVIGAIKELISHQRKFRNHTKVQVSYLLTRENAEHLPQVVKSAADVGVHEFFVVHLDVAPSESLWDLAAFDRNGLLPDIENYLDEAERKARKSRMRFRGPPRKSEDSLACALNPTRFVFVTWDGRVGPCVNLLLPIDGDISRWNSTGFHEVGQVCFGNLKDADLNSILDGTDRMAFIEPFKRRLIAEQEFWTRFLGQCGAKALRQLDQLDEKRNEILCANPFPCECDHCNKKSGW